MRYEKNHLQWPNAETFFYCHLSFFAGKSRCEWFAHLRSGVKKAPLTRWGTGGFF